MAAKRECGTNGASSDMRRGVSKRALFVGIAVGIAVALSGLSPLPSRAAQDLTHAGSRKESAPIQCVIEAVTTLDVRVQTPRGRRTPARTQVIHLEQRHIQFEPITTSLARVRTYEGEPAVIGDARQPWTLRVGTPFEMSGVHVNTGARVIRFAVRGEALMADLDLGDNVELRSARIPCAALTLNATPTPSTVEPLDAQRTRRHARSQTLSLRARAEQGIEAVRLRVPRAITFEEVGRSEPFLHVRATLPFATVDAWGFDTDWVE